MSGLASQVGPFFHGAAGMKQLLLALTNHGPMWHMIDLEAAGIEVTDFSSWEPPKDNPGGCALAVGKDGLLDSTTMWGLPRKLDIIGFLMHCGGSQTPDLSSGVAVLSELLNMVDFQIGRASLLVQGSHMAAGGDVNPEVHGKGMGLGEARDIEEILQAGGLHGPNVPGALMTVVRD